MRVWVAALPAVSVFILTLIISLITNHPQGLFFLRTVRGMPIRFLVVTLILVAPISILPKLLTLTRNLAKNEGLFGQLVRAATIPHQDLSKPDAWVLRPLQGIALSLLFAERFPSLLEFSIGGPYTRFLVRLSLFVIGSALVSLLLSVVWALDDLGVKIYNGKTGEVHLAGRTVGTVLPLITGAIGVSSLFHRTSALAASTDLAQIFMVLYPPYVFFVICHQQFVRRRSTVLSERLHLKIIETNVR